ncbi:adenylyl cyclase-associated protein 1 [Cochliomyia hominivorax]
MFSCCRANPKNSKKSKKVNEENAKESQQQQQENNQQKDASNKNDNKKLIIPTITIENGKTTTDNLNNEQTTTVQEHNVNNKTIDESVKNEKDKLNENIITTIVTETIEKSPGETETVKVQTTTTTITATTTTTNSAIEAKAINGTTSAEITETKVDSDNVVSPANDAEIICSKTLQNSNNYLQNNSDEVETIRNDVDVTLKCSPEKQSQTQTNDESYDSELNEQAADSSNPSTTTATQYSRCDDGDINANSTNTTTNAKNGKPKSCLSRHNSTHTSIKKRVNISVHTEIIEPDPLLPILVPTTSSVGDDEDDVFSDSVPPPKRESMCAPYLERDIDYDDVVTETLAYAHGLPEWFNDERINDVGCIEPPVTPVGRDELELKRQRIYKDLLCAAQAAVKHSARFDEPLILGTAEVQPSIAAALIQRGGDCDPDLKPSVAENLESLVNRLEKLVERLERSISARELEIANRTFDTVLEKKRASFDLETTELPPVPVENLSISEQTVKLNQRIERIEESLGKINERHSLSSRSDSLVPNNHNQLPKDNSLEDIPTVLDDFSSLPPPPPPLELNMSVLGYQDIMAGPLSQYLALSAKIGGDVAKHAEFVKKAFDAQLQYVTLATQCSQPNQSKQMELLKPTSDQITAIQDFREKNRASQYFNHLSAISESIPALGWVCVSPTPGPHVKEMNDAGQFYTNRVLKEWKEKDTTHVEWARAWVQTLTELQQYIKQYHTTGLVWSGKGSAPASGAAPPPPPMGGCPPPPPPPTFDMSNMNLGEGPDDRSALFAEINQGENITKNLKKVTADMQTHKNPTLRTGPAPFKAPTQIGSTSKTPAAPVVKDPVFTRDGKKWLIEYQKNNNGLLVENAEMNNVVYMFKCEGSVLTVKGKVNNIVLDSCKKCSLVFDSVVASIEFVNCQSVQMQVLGFVPTISIDKTDGCQMYLSKESLGVEIVSSKSSEMNIMLPEEGGDYTELPVPEQFKTTISGKTLKTVCVDSLG